MRAVAWGVLLASWSGIALAADLPPPMMPAPPPVYVPVSAPTYNWTSIYLGGNVGYGFAKATATASAAAFGVGASASTSETLNGVLGGGQVGALYQFGYGVVGLRPRNGSSPGSAAAALNTALLKTCRRGSSICMSTPATLP